MALLTEITLESSYFSNTRNTTTLKNKYLIFSLLPLLLIGCATKQSRYLDGQTWRQNSYVNQRSVKNFKSIYLLGNTGASKRGPNSALLSAFKEYTETNGVKDDYLVFLGDNVYNNKLKDNNNEEQVNALLEVFKSFKGKALMIPGENDWNDKGLKGLEKVEDYVEEVLGKDNTFQPENGCPLEVIDVDDDTEIIIIDSQWYIEDWSKQTDFNDKCQLKTRAQFLKLLSSEVRKARHKNVLIFMHHPLYTNGIYGGEMSGNILVKPSPENLYIPFAGALWTFVRTQGGLSKQDQFNPLMNDLMAQIKILTNQAERVFILSAHEQSMQYIEHPSLRQIISGTGSKTEGARLAKDGHFSSGKSGFAELRLFKDGSSKIHFFEFDNKTNKLKQIFEKTAFEQPEPYDVSKLPVSFPKTMKATIYPPEDLEVSEKYERFWGKHYRYMYGVEVEAPVAVLDTLYGGLKVERAGGGNQTQSLRLIGKGDKEYNMRAIQKDPYQFLKSSGYNDLDAQQYFKDTAIQEVLEDFYTASHPYGAFAIPRLAGAVELSHTHPKLFYIPKQKALGDFNDIHGDRLYMIVEKPDEDFNSTHMFGYNEEVESTPDLFEKLREDEKNKLDEIEYIRARIFDLLVGDWDRHEDQWRWAQKDVEVDNNEFLAIPRDRDQVFANFDGKFLEFLQKFIGRTRQFGRFGPDIEFVANFSESGTNLDRALLQHTTKKDWYEQAEYIRERITPEVVDKAFAEVPKEIQDDVNEQIKKDLLARAQNLESIIDRFYADFIRFQTLKATDKDDHIVLTKLENGMLRAEAYRLKDGEDAEMLFDKTLSDAETDELWVYGLDDDDLIEVKGDASTKMKIVIVGGLGEDTYDIENGLGITVYDQRSSENDIKHKGGARFRLNDAYENHIYDSERRPSTGKVVGLSLDYNPDMGAVPTLLIGQQKMGFERNPFTSRFDVKASYFSLTQAFDISGNAHFSHVFGDWNLKFSGRATSHNFTENFFGFGNETIDHSNFDFNRVYLQHFSGGISTYYKGEYGSRVEIGVRYQNSDAELNSSLQGVNALGTKEFIIGEVDFGYRSVDDENYVTRGMDIKGESFYSMQTNSDQTTLGIDPSLTFWNAIDSDRDLVLKTAIDGQIRIGDNVPFYQSVGIGADSGLRSYRQQRFIGQDALTGHADLLYRFTPTKTKLFPLRTFAYLGYDIGRVWIEEESSKIFHQSYGGGFMATMGGFFDAKISYFYGEEGGRLAFGINFGL